MKFDVFISFRGCDTGRSFVSHLYHSLFKKQFRTFKHEEDLAVDQTAYPHVLEAIEESKVAIVVISKNYSSSLSCLDELAKIIECKEKGSLVLVPYEVDPSDFERQAEYLAERDNVRNWEDAFIEMSNTFLNYASGVEEDSDSDMIDKVMDYISPHLTETTASVPTHMTSLVKVFEKYVRSIKSVENISIPVPVRSSVVRLTSPRSSVYGEKYVTDKELSQLVPARDFDSLLGMHRHMSSVYTLLELESRSVLEIGIYGEVGVGKTTLSRYVCKEFSPKFQDHYYHNFLNDTTNYSLGRNSTCLLEELMRDASTPTRYRDVVETKLGHRKVLLIVNGVDHIDQLKYVSQIARWFGPGSRLIIVTQHKNLLLQCGVSRLYEVESLPYDEALQLFSQFAFKQKYITRGFDQLCVRAVLIAGCLPLALKVFGSFLCGKNIKEWEFELLRLEASQDNCIAAVSSYIREDFYRLCPTKLKRYMEEDERNEFPSFGHLTTVVNSLTQITGLITTCYRSDRPVS